MPRLSDLSILHPTMRAKALDLAAALEREGIPLRRYETGRSPFRQAELYLRGRGVGPTGKYVTRAKPWASEHQYGLAEDNVFFVNGAWTWDEPERGMWDRYTSIAADCGLHTLSFERPHVEVPERLSSLQSGYGPPGGDSSWQDWIDAQIEAWGRDFRIIGGLTMPGAPPLMIDRPHLEA